MERKKTMKKQDLTPTVQSKQCLPLHGIFGILALFVVASVSYTTYMVVMGAQGITPKIMVIPQALFAAWIAVYKFSKS